MQLFVFGNGNLAFDDFVDRYLGPLQAVELARCHFLVCDFRGVDTLAMEWLKTRTAAVSVFHMGARPRYLPDRFRTRVGAWELVGGFDSDAARDGAAIARCTHFLAVDQNSDAQRTSGTRRNIEACLAQGRQPLGG